MLTVISKQEPQSFAGRLISDSLSGVEHRVVLPGDHVNGENGITVITDPPNCRWAGKVDAGRQTVWQHNPTSVLRSMASKGGGGERMVQQWNDIWDMVKAVGPGFRELPEMGDRPATADEVGSFLDSLPDGVPVAYDFETAGTPDARRPEMCSEFKVVSVAMAVGSRSICVLIDHPEHDLRALRVWEDWFLSNPPNLVAHNARYEYKCNLLRFGVDLMPRCTMIRSFLEDERRALNLKWVSYYAGFPFFYYKDVFPDPQDVMGMEVSELVRYNCWDAVATAFTADRIPVRDLRLDQLEHLVARDLVRMEMSGIAIDPRVFDEYELEVLDNLKKLHDEIYNYPEVRKVMVMRGTRDFNPCSIRDMSLLVRDSLNIDLSSFNRRSLEPHEQSHPILRKVLDYRSARSRKQFLVKYRNFITGLSRIHSSYNQCFVVTGRLSSTNPPLQNVPKGDPIRKVFISRWMFGQLYEIDLEQQEVRVLARVSGDDNLSDSLAMRLDVHAYVASQIFDVDYALVTPEQRSIGKRMNLGTLYGQTKFGLSKSTGLSLEEADEIVFQFNRKFKGVARWRGEVHQQVVRDGFVDSIFGMRRHLPGAKSADRSTRERAQRQACNFIVQSSSHHIMQITINRFEHLMGDRKFKVVGQVHDSFIVDCSESDPSLPGIVDQALAVHEGSDYWGDCGIPLMAKIVSGPSLDQMKVLDTSNYRRLA